MPIRILIGHVPKSRSGKKKLHAELKMSLLTNWEEDRSWFFALTFLTFSSNFLRIHIGHQAQSIS